MCATRSCRTGCGANRAHHVVTRTPGYVLVAGEDELDTLRFERLARHGARRLSTRWAPPRCSRRRLASGRASRSRTSPTSRSPRPRSSGSRSCVCQRWRTASRPTWRAGSTACCAASELGEVRLRHGDLRGAEEALATAARMGAARSRASLSCNWCAAMPQVPPRASGQRSLRRGIASPGRGCSALRSPWHWLSPTSRRCAWPRTSCRAWPRRFRPRR